MAIGQIEKQYGKGAIMRMGEEAKVQVASIPTGALSLDLALGIGGIPRGRVTEIYGPESSGKTTVALHIVAEAQQAGGIAAFIDAEHALDPKYARALGVDVEALLVSQPDTGEQALEIADMLVRSGAVDVVVVDSVAALTPRAEIEGEMGDSHVGLQARLMSQALRKLAGTLQKSSTAAVFINQIREKVGVMFGSPETTPGGRALKFYSSVRLDVRRIESLKDGNDFVGNRIRVKVAKNKVSAPFRQAEFDILFGEGISKEGAIIDVGVDNGIIKKAGAWYTYDGEQLGQGRENARKFLKEHTDVAAEITKKVTEHLGLVPTDVTGGEASGDVEGSAGGVESAESTESGTAGGDSQAEGSTKGPKGGKGTKASRTQKADPPGDAEVDADGSPSLINE
ncbi:recombinase RecA [Egibacter rhizosphaerae]|uniref:Protein RecA n=1 Tax=Egibacter rhizosphaerae TaxID=1670831 RepID=A0A411YLL1_9ACTN|nr:recombinase RecA [Egibacter rhizosphaerae]